MKLGIIIFLTINSLVYSIELVAHRGIHQNYNRTGLDRFTCTASRINPIEHNYLENTLESIQKAFDLGADIVELDIHPTTERNGIDELVVFHDYTLNCRTEASCELGCHCTVLNNKNVCETNKQSLSYIQSLDIGYGYTPDSGKTFPFRGLNTYFAPSLNDVLELLEQNDSKKILINVKGNKERTVRSFIRIASDFNSDLRKRILYPYEDSLDYTNILKKLEIEDQINQNPQTCLLKYIQMGWAGFFPKECRNIKIFIPLRETLERKFGVLGRNVKLVSLIWGWPERFIEIAHKNGTKVYVSQVDSIDELNQLKDFNFDGIMTNKIEILGPYYGK